MSLVILNFIILPVMILIGLIVWIGLSGIALYFIWKDY